MNPNEGTLQLPPQLSTMAASVDYAYYVTYWISVVFFVAIIGAMLFFIWKYRRKPGVKSVPTGHHTKLELFWTFSPLILLAYLFYIGFAGYMDGAVAPANAHEVRVTAKRWAWEFKHMPTGATEPNQLAAPANEPVRLIMSSVDVLHAFFVPDFRIKRDVVPGMYSTTWFQTPYATRMLKGDGSPRTCDLTLLADGGRDTECGDRGSCLAEFKRVTKHDPKTGKDKPGVEKYGVCHHAIQAYCAEYCGAGATPKDPIGTHYFNHSSMYAKLLVLPAADYASHVQGLYEYGLQPPPECQSEEDPIACWGKVLFTSKSCITCHSVDGSARVGPSVKDLWGRVEAMSDGKSVTLVGEEGEGYIRESILQAGAKIVSGYQPVMPAFAGTISDQEVDSLIAYIKSLGKEPAGK